MGTFHYHNGGISLISFTVVLEGKFVPEQKNTDTVVSRSLPVLVAYAEKANAGTCVYEGKQLLYRFNTLNRIFEGKI